MPHLRSRFALDTLKKKLKFSRIVSIQGARQIGKSVLAKNLFKNGIYTTLDQARVRNEAMERPGTFLESLKQQAEGHTIVIDEAQKVPLLFDEIKSVVDEDNRPGQFLLLGSTEFSHETKIRESLTGRLSRLMLYPLVLSETLQKPQNNLSFVHSKNSSKVQRKELITFLKRGGFPSIFAIRDSQEREDKLNEWVKLTCERDIMQIPRYRPDPDLCYRIMELLPHLEEPNLASLASRLKVSGRKVESQLKILKLIYAIHELRPHRLGAGKPLYYLIDPALVSHFKGGFLRTLETAFFTEFLAKVAYQNDLRYQLYYFRGAKGARAHFVIELSLNKIIALKIDDSEKIDRRELLILESIASKAKKDKVDCKTILLSGVARATKIDSHLVLPWEAIF